MPRFPNSLREKSRWQYNTVNSGGVIMLKIKHKLLSSLIIAAPLFLSSGITTTVHASSLGNKACKSCITCTTCDSTKSANCTANGIKYDCSKLIQSICPNIVK